MKKNDISVHPYWGENNKQYYIPKGSTKLVIGSMPPQRFCINNRYDDDLDFFYGSKDNFFWNIFNYININKNNFIKNFKELENFRIDNEDKCKDILINNGIGIIDIVSSCIHNNNNKGEPLASDEDLLSIKPIDLIEVLKEYINIDVIFCTSEYVKTLLGIYYAESIKYDDDKNKSGEIIFKGIDRGYRFYILYSPTRRVFNTFKSKRDIYMENYLKIFK